MTPLALALGLALRLSAGAEPAPARVPADAPRRPAATPLATPAAAAKRLPAVLETPAANPWRARDGGAAPVAPGVLVRAAAARAATATGPASGEIESIEIDWHAPAKTP